MNRSKKIVQVSLIGILINLILVAFKAAVGFASGSVAIILDAVNNLSDALSSVVTIIGTKLAGRKPDKKHPYGYGQIEYISSVVIAVLILAAGLTSLKESVEKILHPETAHYTSISLMIIAVAVLVKFFLGRYVKKQGEMIHAETLIASGSDAVFDSALSLSTLVAAFVSIFFKIDIEGWLGALISVVILKTGVEILTESLSGIIGARVDSQLSADLKAEIQTFPEVLGVYDLILHRYGPENLIGSVQIEVPDDMRAKEIHRLTRNISEKIFQDYGIVLTVGIYASNTTGSLFQEMKKTLHKFADAYPEILQIHGFYVDEAKKLVSFDLIIDFKCDQKNEIRDSLIREMQQRYPDYRFDAILDSDFSD